MGQVVLKASNHYRELDWYLDGHGIRSFLLVCGSSLGRLAVNSYFDGLGRRGVKVVKFDGFGPNPLYGAAVKGTQLFREAGCEGIIAVGGGSAMDVAKCIKVFSNMDGDGEDGSFLRQGIKGDGVKMVAVPTTAGSGSEATRYAVLYYEGEKQSITHESCIPDAVLMDSSTLGTLPPYQKKAAMLDALCHSIESFWSINSTDESRGYSAEAMGLALGYQGPYLSGSAAAGEKMLYAAHIAGKAINIAQTTAGHAMSYKLTGLYGIAHGHAAALCVRALWPWMLCHTDGCADPRGEQYLKGMFGQLAQGMGCADALGAARRFDGIVQGLGLWVPVAAGDEYGVLCRSVNLGRLKNNPVKLTRACIDGLYHKILRQEGL